MKKLIIISFTAFLTLFSFLSPIKLNAVPGGAWTYDVIATDGCYKKFACNKPVANPVCVKGHETGWVCTCEPWNCR